MSPLYMKNNKTLKKKKKEKCLLLFNICVNCAIRTKLYGGRQTDRQCFVLRSSAPKSNYRVSGLSGISLPNNLCNVQSSFINSSGMA